MGALFSLRRSGGLMVAAAVLSCFVMVIQRKYLEALPVGGADVYGELFFGVQTFLLLAEMVFGLLAVGCCIFMHPPLKGILSFLVKLLLAAAVSAAALAAVWLVAWFGGAYAALAAIFFIRK